MSTTYSVTGSIAVKRIRTPHAHDVLAGRGGAINSHIGNKTFREWVRQRKEQYNLAPSKADKAVVAGEVMELVKSLDPPGRFLQQDPNCPSNQSWWIEIDETRALAKTCQALREGAPLIRAAHKDELDQRAKKPAKKRNSASRKLSALPAATAISGDFPATTSNVSPFGHYPSSAYTDLISESTFRNIDNHGLANDNRVQSQPESHIVAPLMSNKEFDETYGRPSKRIRTEGATQQASSDENVPPEFDALADTPPLTSQPPPRIEIPPLDRTSSCSRLIRNNSLALSDLGDYSQWDTDFVNPFADESDILWMGNESEAHSLSSWNAGIGGGGFISCQ